MLREEAVRLVEAHRKRNGMRALNRKWEVMRIEKLMKWDSSLRQVENCRLLDITPATAIAWRDRYRLKIHRGPYGPGTQMRKQLPIMRRLREEGWSLRKIGRRYGMTREGVRTSLKYYYGKPITVVTYSKELREWER